jgi:hypothetical protein
MHLSAMQANRVGSPPARLLLKIAARLLGVVLLLGATCPMANAKQSVTLAWDPSPSPLIVGYSLYYGDQSGNYTNVTSVGNRFSAVVSNLVENATYYFAVTAFDNFGIESLFSNEVSYTVPLEILADVDLTVTANGSMVLAVDGIAGTVYEIEATTNLLNWVVIGTQTADTNGLCQITDTDAANFSHRFYRTRSLQ